MNEKELIQRLAASVGEVPAQAEIFPVRQYSADELMARARRLLALLPETGGVATDRGDWVQEKGRTLVRLPLDGRAEIFHASGAMKLKTGLAPMEALFPKVEPRETLIKLVQAAAEQLNIAQWVGTREAIRFERLWQIKAAAANREGKRTDPVLCRVVGAYRQFVGKLPVLGAASVAIKLAAGGALDSLEIRVRETAGEPTGKAPILHPDEAARRIAAQLKGLMGDTKVPFTELIRTSAMQFGYFSLGKRVAQPVLAPFYVAAIELEAEEAQAYQLVIPATEKTYLALPQPAADPPVGQRTKPVLVPR